MSDLNNELKERLRLLHGMTPDEARERREGFGRALLDEIAAVMTGKITVAEMKKLAREHAQEIRILDDDLKRRQRRSSGQ